MLLLLTFVHTHVDESLCSLPDDASVMMSQQILFGIPEQGTNCTEEIGDVISKTSILLLKVQKKGTEADLDRTAEWFHSRMCSHVSFEMVVGVEGLLADRTLLGLLALVQLEVLLQQVGLEELQLALGALDVDLQLRVLGHLGHHGVLTHRLILTSSSLGTSRPLLFGLRDNFTPQHQFPETFLFYTSQRFP